MILLVANWVQTACKCNLKYKEIRLSVKFIVAWRSPGKSEYIHKSIIYGVTVFLMVGVCQKTAILNDGKTTNEHFLLNKVINGRYILPFRVYYCYWGLFYWKILV